MNTTLSYALVAFFSSFVGSLTTAIMLTRKFTRELEEHRRLLKIALDYTKDALDALNKARRFDPNL
jgi:nucleoside recognition membrane protein YjiH